MYVLDTNIFNKLVDGTITIDDLPYGGVFIATHIQIDEINRTNDPERRQKLFMKFAEMRPEMVPTESFVLDVSRLGHGKLSDGTHYTKLKQDLDALNKSKSNNIQDTLIAEVAIVNGYTLLTGDRHLAEVTEKHDGKVALLPAMNMK